MKIKKDLPQFKDLTTLIVVTGNQEGSIYFARNGEIIKISHIFEPTPLYSDREGHFMKSRGGMELGQGSVYESKKNYIQSNFIKQIVKKTKGLVKKYQADSIYLFCPSYLKTDLTDSLPKKINDLIVETFYGNFENEKEFLLLEKIKAKNKKLKPLKPIKPEAAKLLKRKPPKD